MNTKTQSVKLADYPDAAIGFIVRLGERYRDLQLWLDAATDGHRDDDLVWFYTLDGAELFVAHHGDRILEVIEPAVTLVSTRALTNEEFQDSVSALNGRFN